METAAISSEFYNQIIGLLQAARANTVRAINQTMVFTYFEIGKRIVEEEQLGKERAGYGKGLLKELSVFLTKDLGRGYSVDNLENMRKFYLSYRKSETLFRIFELPNSETPSRNLNSLPSARSSAHFPLSWSHYLRLMRIENMGEREFYEIETTKNNWSVRELQRQIDSSLYARLALSKNNTQTTTDTEKQNQPIQARDIIKDPYVLEFLGLPEKSAYSESDLEQEIINKLEYFLMELGHGFTFVGRQVRFTFDEDHFRVDLVFYNRILRCFVLIDLKIGKLKHQDLGQMQMYVNYYDRFVKLEEENPTIGIILCKSKNDSMVEITLPKDNQQIFASKYELVLPSKDEFKRIIDAID